VKPEPCLLRFTTRYNTEWVTRVHAGSGTYQLVVDGELGDRFGVLFEGMTLTRIDGTTALTGEVDDQARLIGLIHHCQELGLVLVSMQKISTAETHE
jgi:hypothetical protein